MGKDQVIDEEEIDSPNMPIVPSEDKIPIAEDIIRGFLGSYSRDPFQRQLAKLLGCSPDRKSIQQFANRNPDRWARTVQIFAGLSGYTEKIEVEHNFNIDSMSDAEVERRLAEIEGLLKGTTTVNELAKGEDIVLEIGVDSRS